MVRVFLTVVKVSVIPAGYSAWESGWVMLTEKSL